MMSETQAADHLAALIKIREQAEQIKRLREVLEDTVDYLIYVRGDCAEAEQARAILKETAP